MRLIKLEMYGFKSFARKTEIVFDDGITAIIGPNGSGKSNIADAVRWVLGEQSAKALRGEKMEDVIFNGKEAKKPLSYGEVSLTFDNSDGELATDFTEVCVTRRIYRSGESEYFINRSSCRRKDIAELFRDTGVGKEGYSIIGQGRVEQILSSKSSDRRNAFEEAAGVMKYRVRKEEAERKLESTRGNLERLNDILEELGKQVGPLEEQSAAAREFLKLRDELKEIEINVFLYQYDKLKEKLQNLTETMKQLEEEIAGHVQMEASLGSSCAAEEERERALNASISDMQSKLLSMTKGAEERAGESKVLGERLGNFIKERDQRQAQMERNAQRLDILQTEMAQKSRALETDGEALNSMKAEYATAAGQLDGLNAAIAQKEELLEKQKTEMIDAMNRIADAKILISRFETMRGALVDRVDAIERSKGAIREKSSKLDAEFSEANAHYQALRQDRDICAASRENAIRGLNETNQRLKEAREAARAAEQQAEAGRSRLKVLEEMKRAHEGYYASVRNLLRDSERDMALKRCIEGVVAELVQVPSEYETAIEMALGATLQNIVAPTEEDAKHAIEHLRRNNYGRATLLPVSVMRPRLLDARELSYCKVNGFIGVASDLVSFDEKYRGVFENILGRTVIVKDLDAGIAINRQARSSFRIATLKGDIINPGGSMTGGSTQKREFSLVGREREIEDLKKRSVALAIEQEERRTESEKLEAELVQINRLLETRGEELREREVALATQAEKVDIIRKYVEEAQGELREAELEQSRIRDDIDNIDEQFRTAQHDRSTLEQGNVATQADIRATQGALTQARGEFAKANEAAADQRVAVTGLEKEYAAQLNELERLKREALQLKASVEEDAAAIAGFKAQFDGLTQKLQSIEGDISVERKEVNALTDRLHAMEEERAKHLAALDEMRARRDTLSAETQELRDRQHKAELNMNRAEMELKTGQDKIWEDYELTYENAQQYRRPIVVTASYIRVDELKKAIKALGDVNIASIEDYKTIKERFESLSAQYQDLIAAEADLRQLIEELVRTMENEFRRQFQQIQTNFSEVFSELFGGGQAELVLSDKNDILNCNIEIIAQPPGKRLQLLSLLSGGERALTAIALLFAILKLKPTAFCILDEIETSLDEVNVATVAQYVQRYSKDTQFIMITHRKGSMEVCNALYGVAMEEKGVSKVVSARFSA